MLFALLLLTVLIGVVTERAFRPVRRMAADLAGRGADDLSAVNTAEMPVETHALGVALNGLLARHAEVLAASAASPLMPPTSCARRSPRCALRRRSPRAPRRPPKRGARSTSYRRTLTAPRT